jgi:hypothetical protein
VKTTSHYQVVDLLDALAPDGPMSLCHQYPGGRFAADVLDAQQIPGLVSERYGASQWISVAQIETTSGRGKQTDVRRLLALPNDFDVKPGAFPDKDTARQAVDVISELLHAQPAFIVDTGNGLQAWWILDSTDASWRCASAEDPRWIAMLAAVRRWGRLVRNVCERFGADADPVFELARVMRVPHTLNMKDADNPLHVSATKHAWTPITMAQLLDVLDEYGIPETEADRDAPGEVISASGQWSWAGSTCAYAQAAIAGMTTDSPRKRDNGASARHPWLIGKAVRLAALHRYGCVNETDYESAQQVLTKRFREILGDKSFGTPRCEAPSEIADAMAFGVRKVEGWSDERLAQEFTTREGAQHRHNSEAVHHLKQYDTPPGVLLAYLARLRAWLDLPDPSHVFATLSVAATSDLDGDPVWLLNVAAPSSGKTEAVRMLDDIADARLDDITTAGLLSWSGHKPPRPQGVLVRLGDKGLATFGDLSSLLATSDRGGRDQVFGTLRRVYDGHASRDIAPSGGSPAGKLSWTGRATVVAAVTGAIDNYSSHSDALGPRWLYCRLTERDTAGRRRAARKARKADVTTRRREAAEMVAEIIHAARARISDLDVPSEVEAEVEDAALVTCWGRASVPRSGYGRKDPEGAPEVEDPPRLIRQALMLARGALAIGLDPGDVGTLARRCVLDSMPATRRAVMTVLADAEGEALSTSEVARRAGLHRHVARIALEDLEAVGPVAGRRIGEADELDEDREDRRARQWTLAPDDDGQLVADVLSAHREAMRRWHEKWEPPLSTPPTSTEVTDTLPTLRATQFADHVGDVA